MSDKITPQNKEPKNKEPIDESILKNSKKIIAENGEGNAEGNGAENGIIHINGVDNSIKGGDTPKAHDIDTQATNAYLNTEQYGANKLNTQGGDFMAEFNSFKELLQQEIDAIKSQLNEHSQNVHEQVQNKIQAIEQEKNIEDFLGQKPFVNDFTKQAIKDRLKKELNSETNVGQEIAQVYDAITKDLNNIYDNPNKVIIPKSQNISDAALDIAQAQYKIFKAIDPSL